MHSCIFLVPRKANGTAARRLQYPGTTSGPPLLEFELLLEPGMEHKSYKWHCRTYIVINIIYKYREARLFMWFVQHFVKITWWFCSNIYLYIAVAKAGATAKVVSAGNMPVEWCWVELSEDINFVDSTVDAVAHWHINQPVCSPYWDLKCRNSSKTNPLHFCV